MSHRESVSHAVRKIVAEILGRSFGGTREYLRFAGENALDRPRAEELQHQIASQIGIELRIEDVFSASTIYDICVLIDLEIEREYATRD